MQRGVRYTAPQTFDTRGDAWAWLDREHRLIDRDDWTPPLERLREAEAEVEQAREARRLADQVPTIAEYGALYRDRDNLAAGTRDRYRMLLRLYIKGEPSTITRRGAIKGKPMVKVGLGKVRVTELTRAHVPYRSGCHCNRLRPSTGSASTPFGAASRQVACLRPASANGSFVAEDLDQLFRPIPTGLSFTRRRRA